MWYKMIFQKFKRKSKSQASMEFLMTYGFALMAVLIVFSALVFFGILSPKRFLPEYCILESGFSCGDFSMKKESITILFKNIFEEKVQDLSINVYDGLGNSVCYEYNYDKIILRDDSVMVTIRCSELGATGEKIKVGLKMTYINSFGVEKQIDGNLKAKILE